MSFLTIRDSQLAGKYHLMGAVLGATLAGIDKSHQEHDYAAMCEAWFNTANRMNLVLNRQNASACWRASFRAVAICC
jgi:hypothetical protein